MENWLVQFVCHLLKLFAKRMKGNQHGLIVIDFLPMDHQFRRNKDAFRKNKVENNRPLTRLSGEQIW